MVSLPGDVDDDGPGRTPEFSAVREFRILRRGLGAHEVELSAVCARRPS